MPDRTYPKADSVDLLGHPHPGMYVDLAGKIEYANAPAEDVFSRDKSEMVGKNFLTYIRQDKMSMNMDLLNLLSDGTTTDYKIRKNAWIDGSGEEVYGTLYAEAVQVNGDKKIYLTISVNEEDMEEEVDYKVFGISGKFWKGVGNLIRTIDVWKLLIVTSGLIIILYLLRDILPAIWGLG